ncbi:DinB family protein [Spirosoma sp. KNUC1025]|uniref:DinB family protein n=1 Tax=Spirosoma sp. KNUC1025 TaxID=2894082 RepID=UPI00386780FE|nr:DinB family protein [Spirosoma sp. KNUC1025]
MLLETAEKTTFTVASLLSDYAVYNAWANTQLVNWLQEKPIDLMEQPVPSSFPSLKETLVHIWDTQRFWLAVLQQTPPPPSFRMTGFSGSVQEVFDELVAQSEAFARYVESLSEAQLQENVHFDTPWVSGTRTRVEFIQHCLNHSTYHRGQLVTIGRNVGLTDAPMTDYSFYFLIVK